MDQPIVESDLAEIEQRVTRALEVAPAPWGAQLETRHGIGGGSFVQLGGDPDDDNELYLDLRLGSEHVLSPDDRLDAIVDFLAAAAEDVPRLIAEIRRLQRLLVVES